MPNSSYQSDQENIEKGNQETIVKEQESSEEAFAFEDEEKEYARIKASNLKGLSIIDGVINDLWNKRFWTSVFINIAIVGSALFGGLVFMICVILTGLFHIIDKHTDVKIHGMHQKREYVKYGY